MTDWADSYGNEKEVVELIVSELMTAEFSRISAALNLLKERIHEGSATVALRRALEYAAANLFLKWLNGNEAEGIRRIVSLVSAIHEAVPQSQIVTAIYMLSLFEQGDLRAAEAEFLALPKLRELPSLIEDSLHKGRPTDRRG